MGLDNRGLVMRAVADFAPGLYQGLDGGRY